MRLASFFLLSLLVLLNAAAATDDYPKNPGVDALNYAFQLSLSDQSDVISGHATIDIRFKLPGIQQLRLDLTSRSEETDTGMHVSAVMVDGSDVSYTHEADALLISLASESSPGERISVSIVYSGIPATGLIIGPNKHGDRTFFSDNWPNKARNWLPTIDHPYDKATCEFVVDAPVHYQVISNGLLVEETDLQDGFRRTHWRQSVPIATWLYAIGVARFAVDYVDSFEGKSIQTWVYHQDRDNGFYDFAVPTKAAMQFYSMMVGPYSYEKLANVQSNSVGGGMEAATAIFYGDASVTGDRSERWRNVIIHEVAHQWFGNAVTEYDWDDVWLSEGFATYFTLLFIEHAYGRDAFVDGLESSYRRVKSFYDSRPDYVLVHNNLSDMSQVTTSQTYQKGSWVLHMLRYVVGDDSFWSGIQSYYQEFRDLNATTSDFQRHMEEASGQDLDTFFRQWLYRPGHLSVEGSWHYNESAEEIVIELDQVQTDGSVFSMPIEIGIFSENTTTPRIESAQLGSTAATLRIPVQSRPTKVILDPEKWLLMESRFVENTP
ncbi:MAG: M1 family metallopeptidase [Rhodothermales bacterium]|nr:M1 family metallopeptidase [Rhodothermales bacterium]